MKNKLTSEKKIVNEAFEMRPNRHNLTSRNRLQQSNKKAESQKLLNRFCDETSYYILGYN